MNCAGCQLPIPEERLAAVPGATRCVRCQGAAGDVARVRGHTVYDHKTGGRLEVVSADQLQRLRDAEGAVEDRVSRL